MEYNDVLRQLGRVMVETHRGEVPESEMVTGLLAQADEMASVQNLILLLWREAGHCYFPQGVVK